jgi:small subunit ribosomal protein S16
MIKIRLSRVGAKGNPFYRIVAIDERKKRAGRALEILGIWHPRKGLIKISNKKVDEWKAKGAQVTSAVNKLINKKS